MYKIEDDEALRLQRWALDHYDLWLRVLRLEGTLTQEEFIKTGQEFYNQGLHCANFVLITNYWDYAEPIALQKLQTLAELIQDMVDEIEEAEE